MDDGFEDSPWDGNWDGNGATSWTADTIHGGTYSAKSAKATADLLTSDDLDASTADDITISFWFYGRALDAGDVTIEIWNGSTWDTWFDLTAYSGYANATWTNFSEVITDSQYFISDWKVRINATTAGNESINIDDVLIQTNQ
ncbi:hypothetical protein ACFLTW_05815 [Chloroflexota bacterium]